ncbi:DNA-binding response regulator, OmpR family, contains REC and winged-helix (wHTH) domain [Anaerosphaera aminiphila DSM 21120]|uniref:DNA-binding response regulator, OmpR family, contains REC and winged-helix (WHTH) domain n=1 Tax=Anaerosphaera aminiphila DSM 21120 TaxID=1120995 RepID=A0A1M5NSS2_9FIRM|nr:response regulator transcription factor [Anaerosphaera aminiphila]SHG92249.1 DNA-binding response regulator, OmpR family, contains REC and winged-helix (wHTH) domain [Anaerosphaera aminiphila DSM 21120]
MRNILVVEDDIDINNLLVEILRENNYEVEGAYTAREALLIMKMKHFDLILLDLMMPNMTGEEFISTVRENNNIAIIVISAKIGIETKVEVLKKGADAFIEKPFNREEVLAQVEATIRRYKDYSGTVDEMLTFKEISLDKSAVEVKVENEVVKLTPIEYNILKLLISNVNKIFTKENIYSSVWEERYAYDADTINSHMSNLRNKLKKVNGKDYIGTIWGMGYRLK